MEGRVNVRGEERDGTIDTVASELKIFEASHLEDFKVLIWSKANR